MVLSVSPFMSVEENTWDSFFQKPKLLLCGLFHLQQCIAWRISLLLIALSEIQNKYSFSFGTSGLHLCFQRLIKQKTWQECL